jgi:hypothetical protein
MSYYFAIDPRSGFGIAEMAKNPKSARAFSESAHGSVVRDQQHDPWARPLIRL